MNAVWRIIQVISIRVIGYRARRKLDRAIERAYGAFARQYPRWSDSLFDGYFLRRQILAAVEPSRSCVCLPGPVELARAWTDQLSYFNEETRQRHIAGLTPMAEAYLRGLELELCVQGTLGGLMVQAA
jgi:hypothetical protein